MTQSAWVCSPIIPANRDYGEYEYHIPNINLILTESQAYAV